MSESSIFGIILHSNLFNFAIFLLIIIAVALKFDLAAILSDMKEKVIAEIEKSKNTKNDSLIKLDTAKYEFSKIPDELQEISANAELKMKTLTKPIIADTEQKILNLENNSQRIIEAEQKQTTSNLISKLGLKAVQIAKDDVISELTNNPQLHDKFIKDSIEELDRVVL